MNKTLTKQELVWVITRVIGMIFLWLAIQKIGTLLGVYWLSETSRSLAGMVVKPLLFLFAVYGFLAFYFLRRGDAFVSLVSTIGNQNYGDQSGIEDPDSFKEWLSEDVSRKSHSTKEQLTMYEEWRLERH
ncbi:MAG: hypothetical protein ACSHX7_11980 [Luteolibacter sp.]